MSKFEEAKASARMAGWTAMTLVMLLILCAAAKSTSAQSTDQDSPTAFTANEIKGTGTEDKTEYFYSFSADPGEVTLTFDVKADKNASISGFDYEILNAKGKRLAGGFLDPVRGESKRAVATVSVKGPGTQSLLLKLTVTEYVATYRVRLGGSVAAADSSAALTAGGGVSPAAVPQSTPDATTAQPAAAADATAAQPDAAAAQPAADATAPTAEPDASAAQAVADPAKPGKKINLDFNLKDKLNLLKDIPTSGSMVILLKDGTTQEIQMKNVKSITMKP